MRDFKKMRWVLVLGCLPLMGNGSCGQPLNEDGLFEAWCGDTLCEWEVESGSIQREATWHADDSGVSLNGETAAISQVSAKQFDCFEVDLLTDIGEDTQVRLELDFQIDGHDDGVVEYAQPIDGRDWKQLQYKITPPEEYSSVVVRVRKLNPGRAVLGRILVRSAIDCLDPPLVIGQP